MRLLCVALLALPCRGDDAAATERATKFAAACNRTDFHEIVKLPAAKYVHLMDFSKGIDKTERLGVPCVLRRLLRRPANTRCARWYVGRYDERRRNMYTTAMFENEKKDIDGYAGIRDVHIGLDVGGPDGTPIYAPIEGVIRSFGYNPEAGKIQCHSGASARTITLHAVDATLLSFACRRLRTRYRHRTHHRRRLCSRGA